MPRIVWLDSRTPTNVLQWPVKEVDNLRHNKVTVKSFELQPGTEAQLMDVTGVQVVAGGPFEVDHIRSLSSTDNPCQSVAQLTNIDILTPKKIQHLQTKHCTQTQLCLFVHAA